MNGAGVGATFRGRDWPGIGKCAVLLPGSQSGTGGGIGQGLREARVGVFRGTEFSGSQLRFDALVQPVRRHHLAASLDRIPHLHQFSAQGVEFIRLRCSDDLDAAFVEPRPELPVGLALPVLVADALVELADGDG